MTGRPYRRERIPRPAVRMVNRGEHRPGRPEDRGPARVVHHGVQKQRAAASRADGREAVEVGARVHGEHGVDRAGAGLPHLDARPGASTVEQDAKAGRRLGMVGARVVAEAVGVGEDGNGHRGIAR